MTNPLGSLTMDEMQKLVNEVWLTDDSYCENFHNACDALPHLPFTHALLHLQKAVGKIVDAVDDADHMFNYEKMHECDKYIADLVICAARLANTRGPELNLGKAVLDRLCEIEQREIERKAKKNA